MLLYDHERTEKIVERLRNAESIVRVVTILTAIAFFTLMGLSAGAASRSSDGVVIGAVIGGIVGFGVGNFSMVLLSAVIEWMCQLLIAQGQIVEAAKRKPEG